VTAPWWTGRALGFDTESTGVDVREERIVTVALVYLTGDGKPHRQSQLINPGIDIPEGATAVHGITTAVAKEHGVAPALALESTAAALARVLSKGVPVVGMNICFDFALLHFDCLRNGVPTLSERLGGHDRIRPVVDCLVLDKAADKYRKGSRKLDALCETYGVTHHGAHDSAYDALAAAEVASAIAAKHGRIGSMGLDELHDAQVAWKAEQNAGLQEYFDRKREPNVDRVVIDTGWPLYDMAKAVSS
jgi:DNA polymerase III subunit epsilon